MTRLRIRSCSIHITILLSLGRKTSVTPKPLGREISVRQKNVLCANITACATAKRSRNSPLQSPPLIFPFPETAFSSCIPYYFRRVLDEKSSAAGIFLYLPTLLYENPYAEFPSFGGFANILPRQKIERKDTAAILIEVMFCLRPQVSLWRNFYGTT